MPATVVRDLGIYIDSMLMFQWDHLWLLRRIATAAERPPVCFQIRVPVTIAVSLVLSRLDHGNATLSGNPQYLLKRLQSVMNSTARLVFSSSRYDHITPLLRQLHALAQGGGANRLQACCPCVQVLTWSSTVVPCWWTLPVDGSQPTTSPSFSAIFITGRPPYASVNHRRQSFSCRRRTRVEWSAAARNVCTLSVYFSQTSDSWLSFVTYIAENELWPVTFTVELDLDSREEPP